jgi:hypothetical protein
LIPGIVRKLSVTTVIVLNADTLLGGKLLKCLLGKDGLSGGGNNLEVHTMQSGVVVKKKRAVSVPLLGECILHLGKKPTSADSI